LKVLPPPPPKVAHSLVCSFNEKRSGGSAVICIYSALFRWKKVAQGTPLSFAAICKFGALVALIKLVSRTL
jgi:hypothetical protein